MTTNKLRVLLDTNVYISYLLNREGTGAVARIVQAARVGTFTLLVPEALVQELTTVVAQKPYLVARIAPEDTNELIFMIRTLAEVIGLAPQTAPLTSRDPDDDYLLTAAVIGQADYLVTGDDDLLTLAGLVPVAIVSPAAFVQV